MKVFICFTPLHILIAKRIIQVENITKYIFIYLVDNDSKKNNYYYQQLAKHSEESYYIVLSKKLPKDIIKIIKLSILIKKKYVDLIYYSGKIKSSHNRLLMYLTGYKNYITFDDGSGNISGKGYFYEEKEQLLFSLFFRYIKKDLLYKNIKRSVSKHYTIFKVANVFPNAVYIDLFTINEKSYKIPSEEKITILLTNAFAEDGEMSLDEEKLIYEKIVKKFNVTYIIKHPREKFNKIEKIKELKSLKIAEELIYDLSKKYKVKVIGIYSTSLINIANFPNVKIINIEANLKKPIKGIANILNNLDIRSLNV